MEVYTPTCVDVKTCSSRRDPASTRDAHMDALLQAKAAAGGHGDGADENDNKLLAALQKKKASNAAVHVVVVINDQENPHSLNIDCKRLDHAECRICQEEEELVHLDNPCACTGTLMYAHRKCVQRWCDEKGDTTCEICQQPYKSGYTASPAQPHFNVGTVTDLSEQVEVQRDEEVAVVVATTAQRRFLDGEYEEANSSSATCCRSAALLLMVLLLIRHAMGVVGATDTLQEDTSMLISLFLLRVVGFLLPCYIMVRAMNMLQRRHRDEDVSMSNMHATTTEVAIILQTGRL